MANSSSGMRQLGFQIVQIYRVKLRRSFRTISAPRSRAKYQWYQIVLRLPEREVLIGIVRSPAHGDRDTMSDSLRSNTTRNVGRARSPVMADHRKVFELKHVNQVN